MTERFHIGRVVQPHMPTSPSSLHLRPGDVVRIEEELPHEPGWLLCRDMSGASGRVPKAFLSIDCDSATVRQEYQDTQLAIRGGKVIIVGEESGWVWCVDKNKQYGWVPRKKIKLLE